MEKLRLTWVYGTANLIGQQAKNMETPENKLVEIPAAPQPPVKFQPVKFVHERSRNSRLTMQTEGGESSVGMATFI